MKASKLIEILQDAIEEHGDIPCIVKIWGEGITVTIENDNGLLIIGN
jgi:hypothetical protein